MTDEACRSAHPTVTPEWAMQSRENAWWHALADLRGVDPLEVVEPNRDEAWTLLVHPLALALLEWRAPDVAWWDDPFVDPRDRTFAPCVRRTTSMVSVTGLAAPSPGVDPGSVIDADHEIAWSLDSSPDETRLRIHGRMPDGIVAALADAPLARLTAMPPTRNRRLASALSALRIERARPSHGDVVVRLHPARWIAAAPPPPRIPTRMNTAFLDKELIR